MSDVAGELARVRGAYDSLASVWSIDSHSITNSSPPQRPVPC